MLDAHLKESKPLFLWILLVGTTLVLALVVYFFVVNRSGEDENRSIAALDAQAVVQEKEYTKEVRGLVLSYISKVQNLKQTDANDRAKWKTLATELHAALLNIPGIPPRMQTIHLSIVLSVSQVMAALGAGGQSSLFEHVDQLNAIILALG